jgi:hypothetical protein
MAAALAAGIVADNGNALSARNTAFSAKPPDTFPATRSPSDAADTFTDLGHDAGYLAADGKRKGGLDLVATAALQDVGKVQANGWTSTTISFGRAIGASLSSSLITSTGSPSSYARQFSCWSPCFRHRVSVFTLTVVGSAAVAADTSLVLMPTVSKVQEGPPTEEIWLVRDEVANMVWALERAVPLASGDSKPGLEAE